MPPSRTARINPFEFAEAAGVGAETALDLFVHGAKLGLFDLEWGMICTLCGGITHSVAELDRVAEDTLHCSLCDKDVESVLDDTVEVSTGAPQAMASATGRPKSIRFSTNLQDGGADPV